MALVIGLAFYSLEMNVPEYEAPPPSGGEWAGEEDFGPQDIRPNVPSLFTSLTEADAGI